MAEIQSVPADVSLAMNGMARLSSSLKLEKTPPAVLGSIWVKMTSGLALTTCRASERYEVWPGATLMFATIVPPTFFQALSTGVLKSWAVWMVEKRNAAFL